ncbi:penicillin-binding protein 1A [Desulfogranum mediterraneum]|uniref:penicillin-binding protein 1A n=1 Tax=Desulfogranum mediterraneum TaxID=160661 RepID=UPI00040F1FBA|nr:PBP1A family penicillin-binding protein [Desulfogranum mediterraneum]
MSTKPAQKKRSPARKKSRPKRRYSHIHLCLLLLACGGLVTLLIGTGLAWLLMLKIPDIRSIDDYRPQVATVILDRHGKPLDAIYNQYRLLTPLNKMPRHLAQAFVAAEDSRFWEHPGVDLWSIGRAAVNNLISGRRSQGGSTITQQVTRALMLTREKSYRRKLTESILAYRLNRTLSKEEILYIYLNEIYLGAGAYGVAAAAQVYFGKPLNRLDLAECAILAGLPQAPSRYSPLKHPQAAKARQRYVLNRMAEEGYIQPATARWAYIQPLRYRKAGEDKSQNGYFSAYVRSLLAARYGREAIFHQGLTVSTTLDSRLQRLAQRAILEGSRQVGERQQKTPPQGALVAMEADSGRIRAMVGGTNYSASPFNRAVEAKRQPGSVFKPLIYAAALQQGMSLNQQINDAPLAIRNRNGSTWRPHNYDRSFRGPTSLAQGLIHSRNIVAIKLLRKTGIKPVIRLARQAGISTPLEPDLTLALGTSPVSLLEMTGAYSAFAGQGYSIRPVCITSVRDHRGRRRAWPQPKARQIIRPESARSIKGLLSQAVSRGTGRKAAGIPGAAGKTGTSNNNTDAWFIGFSGRLLAGVWLGHDRNQPLGKGETGGRAAAPIWKTFMQEARP